MGAAVGAGSDVPDVAGVAALGVGGGVGVADRAQVAAPGAGLDAEILGGVLAGGAVAGAAAAGARACPAGVGFVDAAEHAAAIGGVGVFEWQPDRGEVGVVG